MFLDWLKDDDKERNDQENKVTDDAILNEIWDDFHFILLPPISKLKAALSKAPLANKWAAKELGTEKHLADLFTEFVEDNKVCLNIYNHI